MEEDRRDAGEVTQSPIDDTIRGSLAPYVAERHRHTIDVLVLTLLAGRKIEAWLSETVAVRQLDTSSFSALAALWLAGPPHSMSAGELAQRIVQTSGGVTKTMRRLVDRGLVRRVADPRRRPPQPLGADPGRIDAGPRNPGPGARRLRLRDRRS